jgi:hypothetical protein
MGSVLRGLRGLGVSGAALGIMGAVVAVAACIDAPQTVSGGDLRFDAAPPTAPLVVDAAAVDLCLQPDSGSAGETTWSALYRDYFGGGAACAGTGACHGAATQPGALASGGYVCPRGDATACFDGITNPKAHDLDPSAVLVNVGNPEGSGLYQILRKVNGTMSLGQNQMPQKPECYFSERDMARILTWMRNGAKND